MLGPGRVRLRARGIDDDVGAEPFGERAAGPRIIGGDDRMQSPDLQRRGDRETNPPAAEPPPLPGGPSPPLILAFATACTPTASGSVSAACSAARPFGTSSSKASLSSMR